VKMVSRWYSASNCSWSRSGGWGRYTRAGRGPLRGRVGPSPPLRSRPMPRRTGGVDPVPQLRYLPSGHRFAVQPDRLDAETRVEVASIRFVPIGSSTMLPIVVLEPRPWRVVVGEPFDSQRGCLAVSSSTRLAGSRSCAPGVLDLVAAAVVVRHDVASTPGYPPAVPSIPTSSNGSCSSEPRLSRGVSRAARRG
jgi:hypothetical protein